MSANVPTDIRFSFKGLAVRGGEVGPHRDGFGIVFYHGKGLQEFRDVDASCDSPVARLVENLPIRSKAVIAHVRQANAGAVNLENTHPFHRELFGRHFTFAHNGQLPGVKKLPLGRFNQSARPILSMRFVICWINWIWLAYPAWSRSVGFFLVWLRNFQTRSL